MSRGPGALQRQIKEVLDRSLGIGLAALPFARLRDFFVLEHGGRPEAGDRLSEARERSLKAGAEGVGRPRRRADRRRQGRSGRSAALCDG
jgi:hypothetical protein